MSNPDFGRDPLLNAAAANVVSALEQQVRASPGFAGVQITPTGVELDYVGVPNDSVASAVSQASSSSRHLLIGISTAPSDGVIPVFVRQVAHTELELLAVTNLITTDQPMWAAKGVTPSSYGPDAISNTVLVNLLNYSPAVAAAFVARYGSAVTVATTSQSAEGIAVRYNDSVPLAGEALISRLGSKKSDLLPDSSATRLSTKSAEPAPSQMATSRTCRVPEARLMVTGQDFYVQGLQRPQGSRPGLPPSVVSARKKPL